MFFFCLFEVSSYFQPSRYSILLTINFLLLLLHLLHFNPSAASVFFPSLIYPYQEYVTWKPPLTEVEIVLPIIKQYLKVLTHSRICNKRLKARQRQLTVQNQASECIFCNHPKKSKIIFRLPATTFWDRKGKIKRYKE